MLNRLSILLMFLPSLAWAQAIPNFPPASLPLSGSELVPIVQMGVTVQTGVGNIAATGALPVISGYSVVGNPNSGSAVATSLLMPSCSSATNGLTWITGAGFGCNTFGPFANYTGTQATAALNLFTSSLQGLVPASGGGTTTFLRADGTFAAPAVSGGLTVGTTTITSGTSGRILYDNAGVLGELSVGTGVATALGVNVGTAGSVVVNGGALGTPSSGTATNLSGTASGLTAGNIRLLGSSTGYTTFASANAGASNYTQTFQAVSGTVADLDVASQVMTGGVLVTAAALGTISSGTTTINCGTSPLQWLTNGGAFTLAAPSSDSSCIVEVENNGSAGVITFSGFSVGTSTGDAIDTTNGHYFDISIICIHGHSTYRIAALQ